MQRLHIDTDLGDDIDDAYAVALASGSPELELTSLSTVYGNVAARARQARTLLHHAGRSPRQTRVGIGLAVPLDSRASEHGESWHRLQGDPDATPCQDGSCLPREELWACDEAGDEDGVGLLAAALADEATNVALIGPLSNAAAALRREPALAQRRAPVSVMCGDIRGGPAEYNVLADVTAADEVLRSGLALRLFPAHLGHEVVRFTGDDLRRLASIDTPLARNVAAATEAWRTDHAARTDLPYEQWLPKCYDLVAIAASVEPSCCRWRRGRMTVEAASGADVGRTTFVDDAEGPHEACVDADREVVLDLLFAALASAGDVTSARSVRGSSAAGA